MNLVIHTDGGARGNPGQAAVGVVIKKVEKNNPAGRVIVGFGRKIGVATNNVAEYTAVVAALDWLFKNQDWKFIDDGKLQIKFFLDSRLVAMQLSGLFKIKDPHLRELLINVRNSEAMLDAEISYHHIPREKNQEADYWVNSALDVE